MGLQHRRGASMAKHRRRHAGGRRLLDDVMPGRCPHKLIVWVDGAPHELRCRAPQGEHERIRSNTGAEATLHRHDALTWT